MAPHNQHKDKGIEQLLAYPKSNLLFFPNPRRIAVSRSSIRSMRTLIIPCLHASSWHAQTAGDSRRTKFLPAVGRLAQADSPCHPGDADFQLLVDPIHRVFLPLIIRVRLLRFALH